MSITNSVNNNALQDLLKMMLDSDLDKEKVKGLVSTGQGSESGQNIIPGISESERIDAVQSNAADENSVRARLYALTIVRTIVNAGNDEDRELQLLALEKAKIKLEVGGAMPEESILVNYPVLEEHINHWIRVYNEDPEIIAQTGSVRVPFEMVKSMGMIEREDDEAEIKGVTKILTGLMHPAELGRIARIVPGVAEILSTIGSYYDIVSGVVGFYKLEYFREIRDANLTYNEFMKEVNEYMSKIQEHIDPYIDKNNGNQSLVEVDYGALYKGLNEIFQKYSGDAGVLFPTDASGNPLEGVSEEDARKFQKEAGLPDGCVVEVSKGVWQVKIDLSEIEERMTTLDNLFQKYNDNEDGNGYWWPIDGDFVPPTKHDMPAEVWAGLSQSLTLMKDSLQSVGTGLQQNITRAYDTYQNMNRTLMDLLVQIYQAARGFF